MLGTAALGLPLLSPCDIRQQQPPREQQRPQTPQLHEQKAHGGRHTDLEGLHGHGARGSGKHLFPTGHPAGPEGQPRSTIHWERLETLRQLAMAHEFLAAFACGDALNRYALQLGLEPSASEGAKGLPWLRNRSWRTAGLPDRAAGPAGGGRGPQPT
jgi:hypothetical protein